jgi:hypothetical protein
MLQLEMVEVTVPAVPSKVTPAPSLAEWVILRPSKLQLIGPFSRVTVAVPPPMQLTVGVTPVELITFTPSFMVMHSPYVLLSVTSTTSLELAAVMAAWMVV